MKRNNLRYLLVAIMLALVVALSVFSGACGKPAATTTTKPPTTTAPTITTPPVQPITLVFACHESSAGIMYKTFWKPWEDEIKNRTGGRVIIEGHYNAELAGPPDAWDVVINKTVDMSYVHLQNFPGKFPMCEVVAFHSYGLVNQQPSTVLLELYNKYPEMQQELSEVHLLMLGTTYWTSWAGPKPIRTLEDGQGMKVLGVGKWQNRRLEVLGQVPVSMGPMDILPSLQTGVIDNGPNGTMMIALDFGYIDYLPYWTHVQTENIPLIIGVNLDVWNSLPADIRQILDDMVPWTTALWDKMWVDMEHELYPTVEEKAIEIYTPPADELARWDALDKPVWDEFAANLNAKGLPGTEFMADYIKLEQQYSIPLAEWTP